MRRAPHTFKNVHVCWLQARLVRSPALVRKHSLQGMVPPGALRRDSLTSPRHAPGQFNSRSMPTSPSGRYDYEAGVSHHPLIIQ